MSYRSYPLGAGKAAILLLAIMVSFMANARGDEVILTNGDRITGLIDSAADGKLVINSPLEGKVTVDLMNVKTFSTSGPIKIVLSDGTVIEQRVTDGNAGTIETAPGGPLAPQPVPLSSIAKINPPPVAWTGNVVVNYSLSQGNAYSESFGASLDMVRRSDIDRWELQGMYQFAKQKVNGIASTSIDQWDIEATYNYFFTKQFYALGDVRVEKNRIQYLNLRVTPNAGLGYQFFEQPDFNANIEGGVGWVYQEYTNNPSASENVSLRLAYHIDKTLWGKLKLFSDAQYFPSVQDIRNYIIIFDAGLHYAFTKQLFGEVKGLVNYNSEPPPPSGRCQTQLIVGAGWTF